MSRLFTLALGMGVCILLDAGRVRGADTAPVPGFTRHVEAVFSRLGCNGGACHGAVKGQNGFKLSLFGADPAADYDRLLHEFAGRRLNLLDPDSSLLLLKATGQAAHQGGKRMTVGSPEYDILRRWIAAGVPAEPAERSHVTQLRVTPAEQTIKPGEKYRLRVEAKFADGATEDVTALCSYESLAPAVAAVGNDGQVTARGVGDAAIIVRFRAEPALTVLLVPRPSADRFPEVKPQNFVDRHVLDKLRRLNVPPAELTDDATFLRRVSLDVTGELPSPKEVRAFLADKSPDKRSKKIDELLNRPGYAALWTLKFCDLLKANDFGVYADGIRQEMDAPRFQQWVRARMEENMPYDQFVDRILTATSRDGRDIQAWAAEIQRMEEGYAPGRKDCEIYKGRKTLDLYWQRSSSAGVPAALQVAHSFLGLRLECAQCHRHPHDVWQQDDLLSFANFFMNVRKIGFQGDNEKKYPEVAAIFKKMNDDAKKLTDDAKKLRDGEYKKAETAAKTTKSAAAQAEFEKVKQRLTDMERESKLLPEAARRVMHSEVRLVDDKANFATVTSPLGTDTSKRMRLLGQSEAIDVSKGQDPRQIVMAWLKRPDNPYFARAIVNRVWAHYFGRGIIDPPDNLSSFNPASHPELLKELCDGFIKNKYDLKWLHRTILNSRTYQQSSTPAQASRGRSGQLCLLPLSPAAGRSAGRRAEPGDWDRLKTWTCSITSGPNEMKAVEIPFTPRNAFVTFMLSNFGKPKRNSAVQCDCERDGDASVLQVLSFANHPRVWAKIADEKGQVARIAKEIGDAKQRIEELYLLALGRLPNDAEQQACAKYLDGAASPLKGLQGIAWSLLNTREFVLQH